MTNRQLRLRRELLGREQGWRRIFNDRDVPFLVSLMTAVDSRTGDEFTFAHVREPLEPGEVWLEGNALRCEGWDGPAAERGGNKTWRWQRYLIDRKLAERRTIDLKGRQIGDTWTDVAVDVAQAILLPGTSSLMYRQREDDAVDNVRRWWTLYNSLPKWVLERVPSGKKTGPIRVSKPDRGDRPGRDGISLIFADGRFSDIVPMTSAASSGHGRSVRSIQLDEAAHIEKLLSIRAAVEPAAGQAHIGMISTANGRSNEETGEGNEFHRVWSDEESGYHRLFLGYYLHPDRDEWWYANDPEVRSLPIWKRQEQFPRNEQEAFALSDRIFFDEEGLQFYAQHIEQPKYRFNFVVDKYLQAKAVKHPEGRMRMFRPPLEGRKYAIAADVASGHGRDFSAAYVIDLETMEWCVEYHAKVGEDEYATDLYWLGKWYNTALIAPETQGGHGTAVVIQLRGNAEARKPYPKLYRHRNTGRSDRPDSSVFGFPMGSATRPLVVNQIEQHVREMAIPFVTDGLHYEMTEFVEHDHGTSPRARDGSRDDRVMAAAIALDLFRQLGMHVGRAAKRTPRDKPPPKEKHTPKGFNESRYPKRK